MKTLVIAPHPDDETLGCGGTLLRRKAEGADTAWLMVTAITEEEAMSSELRESAWFSAKSGVVSGPGECSSMGLGLSESPSRDCLK